MNQNSSIDSVSAGLLLQIAASPKNIDKAADLYKSFNKPEGGPSKEAIAFFNANKGKKCSIKYTDYIGEIVKLNTSDGGFYPGNRFPIYVKILESTNGKYPEAVGQVFEYDLPQIQTL